MYVAMTAVTILAFLALASLGLRVVEELERENRLTEAELQASLLYRESLQERADQVRRYRHDADGLLRAIEHAQEREVRYAGDTLEEAGADAEAAGDAHAGLGTDGHRFPLVEAAVESKRLLCADAGISFICRVDSAFAGKGASRGVNEADLCIVLQNLLDNAYEASLDLVHAGAEASMSLHMDVLDAGLLRIAVRNKTASSEPPTFKTRKGHPELHGVGLRVVKEIARSYSGSFTTQFDPVDRQLTMTVVL